LSSEQYWSMTPREIQALGDVHHQMLTRWALERAMFANVHFRTHDKSGNYTDKPFEPGHFLGEKTREAPKPKKVDPFADVRDKMAILEINRKLGAMKKGDPPPPGLPEIFWKN
jgi:hypothetical protein